MSDKMFNDFKRAVIWFRNSWITVWLVVVTVIFGITASFAAYTGVTTSKRVISLSDRDDMLFSSRYLFASGSEVQKVGFAESETDPKITIDVCNFDKNGLGKYSKDIFFTLEARLVNYDGTELTGNITSDKYKIAYLDGTSESAAYVLSTLSNSWQTLTSSLSGNVYKLPGGTKTSLKFVLHCDSTTMANPQYAVEVKATPTPAADYDDLKLLSGKMRAVSRSSQNLEWSGEFTDKLIDAEPKKFDAYNYVISGIGKGKITLTYDSESLELDKKDLAIFSAITGNTNNTANGKTVITFDVDTTVDNAVSRYAIHFYQKTGEPITAFSETYVKTEFNAETESKTDEEG